LLALGIDIGGTQIKAGLVDAQGQTVRSAKTATPLAMDALERELGALLAGLVTGEAIEGVGVGCKGIIDPQTTRVVRQPGIMGYLEGAFLSDLVRRGLGFDTLIYADNDARVMLTGECVWGAARGLSDALMFTLGTGVGGGILSGGRILRGHGGVAGHLGHVTVEPDGPPCICGNHGCLEATFSARVIEADAWSAIHRGVVTSMGSPGAPPKCEQVFAAAADGDPAAQWIVQRRVRKLAAAVAGLVNALDPEVVILGGQIASAGDALFAPIREEVEWRTRGLLVRSVPVVPMEVADPSGIVGAAALVFEAQGYTGSPSRCAGTLPA
jgi:glucokinase